MQETKAWEEDFNRIFLECSKKTSQRIDASIAPSIFRDFIKSEVINAEQRGRQQGLREAMDLLMNSKPNSDATGFYIDGKKLLQKIHSRIIDSSILLSQQEEKE